MARRTSHRGKLGGVTVNRAEVRDALEDGRVHCAIGLVVHRPNDDSHFTIETDANGNPVDVSVEVDLMPRREAVTARLGALAGGTGSGIWRVPPPGTEVMVMIPRGELENGPVIVGELSTRGIPGALDQDSLVIINPGKVILASKNSKVYVGAQDGTGTEPAVLGNSLQTRLADLENKFLNHTHTTALGACTAGGATGATASTSPNSPNNSLPHSGDNIKASGIEVK